MTKTLKSGISKRNEPPQPQFVVFFDLVGVDIAPVSKKTAVKYLNLFDRSRIIGLKSIHIKKSERIADYDGYTKS